MTGEAKDAQTKLTIEDAKALFLKASTPRKNPIYVWSVRMANGSNLNVTGWLDSSVTSEYVFRDKAGDTTFRASRMKVDYVMRLGKRDA